MPSVELENNEIYLNLNPVNFLVASGILQGLIISVILFFKKNEHRLSSRLLASTIVAVSMHLAYLILLDFNLEVKYPNLLWLPFSFLSAIGPLIYFYSKSLTDSGFRISRDFGFHFIPLFIELLFHLIQAIYSIKYNVQYYNQPLHFPITLVTYIWTAFSIFYYLRLSLQVINAHESRALKSFSNLDNITLKWLHKLIVYYRLLWICWIPFIIFFLLMFQFQMQYFLIVIVLYVLILTMTYLTYWIGIEGLRRIDNVSVNRPLATPDYSTYAMFPASK